MTENVKRELAVGAATSFIVNGIGKVVVFIGYVFLARWLGVEAFGIFNIVIAVTMFLGILSSLGLPIFLLRFVASHAVVGHWADVRLLIRRCLKLGLISSLAVMAMAAVVIVFFLDLDEEIETPLLIGLLIIPLTCISLQRQQTLRALKCLISYRLSEMIVVYLALMIIGGVVWFFGMRSVIDGMVVRVVAEIIALIAGSLLLHWALKARAQGHKDPEPIMPLGELITISLPLMLVFLSDRIIGLVDIVFLSFLSTPAETGIYTAAARVALAVSLAQAAISTIAAPLISESYKKGDGATIRRILIWSCLASGVFGLCVCLGIGLLHDFILGLFGEEFKRAKTILFILLLGQFIISVTGPIDFILAMTGRQKELSIAVCAGAIASITLCPVLIISYEGLGAAIATTSAIFIWKSAAVITAWREFIGPELTTVRGRA